MRILTFSHSYFPKIGGREVVVWQLSQAMQALGHDVRIVGPMWSRTKCTVPDSVNVHRYLRVGRNFAEQGAARQFIGEIQLAAWLVYDAWRWGCDVIHAHSLYPAGYVIDLLRALLPNVPVVLTPHGIDINTVPESGYGMRLDRRLCRKIDQALAGAQAVTGISNGVIDALIHANVPNNKIHAKQLGVS